MPTAGPVASCCWAPRRPICAAWAPRAWPGGWPTIELSPFTEAEARSAGYGVQDHWLRGGFPPSLPARDDAASARWREAFIASFLERDLALLGIRTTTAAMSRFWHMAAHLNGQLLNLSALANALDVSHTTVRMRVDEMVGAFMLRLLPPFAANFGKRLVKSPKLYLRDSGLLHSRPSPDRDDLFAHPAFGSSWEGYVVQQALSAAKGWQASFYRTANGAGRIWCWNAASAAWPSNARPRPRPPWPVASGPLWTIWASRRLTSSPRWLKPGPWIGG